MGIASASFNHVVYCNELEPVLLVVKRVAGHCIVMNCIVSPRYQSPPAYLVAAPRPRSSDGPARCLLTVNKTNFGIINIFVSPSPSTPPLPIKERTMLQFRQCVTIWSCGLLYVFGEYGKSSVNCVYLLFQTIQNMSSDYRLVNPIAWIWMW